MGNRDQMTRWMNQCSIDNVTLPITAGAATGTATHEDRAGVIHTTITLTAAQTAIISAGDNAAKGGGVKIFDFPTGCVLFLGSKIKGTLSLSQADMSTTAGEIGLGSVVASGAVAVLNGTATFEDIHAGGDPALANISAAGTAVFTNLDWSKGAIPAAGTVATAVDLYLNAATTFADATAADLQIAAGATIEFWWIWLGT